ncbi:MAG: hypothetical protein ACI38V_06175 [Bacteroides sp.]
MDKETFFEAFAALKGEIAIKTADATAFNKADILADTKTGPLLISRVMKCSRKDYYETSESGIIVSLTSGMKTSIIFMPYSSILGLNAEIMRRY